MTQKYFLYNKKSHAAISVFPHKISLGDMVLELFGTRLNSKNIVRLHQCFADPSIVILCQHNWQKPDKELKTILPDETIVYGEFMILGSNEDFSKPELLTWGQSFYCARTIEFIPERSILTILEFDD